MMNLMKLVFLTIFIASLQCYSWTPLAVSGWRQVRGRELTSQHRHEHENHHHHHHHHRMATIILRSNNKNDDKNDMNLDATEYLKNMPPPQGFSTDEAPIPLVPEAYMGAGLATALAWVAVAWTVLQGAPHPDPRFASLSSWHNALTVAQALAFPLPLLAGVVATLQKAARHGGWARLEQLPFRRLNLGLWTTSIYLTIVARNYGAFSFGYGALLPVVLAKKVGLVHLLTTGITWGIWKASVRAEGFLETPYRLLVGVVESFWKMGPSSTTKNYTQQSLYAMVTVLFGGLTLFPFMVPYPAATVPSILGKRLCRPASAFYALATTSAFVLKDVSSNEADDSSFKHLRRGLGLASAAHLGLLVFKLLGIDGGGWWLPGTGLQDNYPAMVATPFWTAVSMVAHLFTIFATTWSATSTANSLDSIGDANVLDAEIVS